MSTFRRRNGSPHTDRTLGLTFTLTLTLMMVLGGLFSPMLPAMAADTQANAAAMNSAQPLEPLDPPVEGEQPPGGDIPAEQPPEEPPPAEEAPVEQDAPEVIEAEPVVPATITVNLYWCPTGSDVANVADGNTIKPACTLQGETVNVGLTSTTNSVPAQSGSSSTFPGQVIFGQLQPDTWSLSITSTNLASQGMFCDVYDTHGNTKPYARYAFVQQGVSLDTLNGELNIFCDWFGESSMMTPTADGTSVTIYKWECPEGTAYGQTDAYYAAECDTEQAGVPFEVTDDNGTQPTTSDTNGRQIDDLIGEITIMEKLPPSSGYGNPAIFCQLLNDADSTDYSSTSPSVTLQPSADDDYQCRFYNIPDDGTSVTIYKWECPAGTLAGQPDSSYYSAECATEQAGVPFEITDDNGTQPTTSDTNGRQIDGLIGEFTIKENIPTGFGNPAIFCQLLNDVDSTDYSSGNGSVTLPASADDDYQCWFYNIPTTDTGYGDVMVYKFECTTVAPANSDYAWYFQNCTTPMNGVTFVLDTPSVDIQTDTGDSINGAVMMGGVETGTYPLTETVPATHQIGAVFCATIGTNVIPGPSDFAPAQVTGSSIDATVTTDMIFYCNWFNVPLDSDGYSMLVYKWDCGSAVIPAAPDHTWYATNCTTPMNGVTFVMNTPSIDVQTQTGDTINGAVMFGGADAGSYPLTETPPSGYTTQAVYCATLPIGDTPTSAMMTEQTVVGNAITAVVTIGNVLHCDWFNAPTTDDGTSVTIYKWECPAGTLYGQTDAYYAAECATEHAGVPFEVTDTIGTQQTTSDTNGRQINGLIGQFSITEMVPAGYGHPAIFCQLLNDAQSTDYSATSPSVTLPASFDDDYQCWFYNIPDDGTSVTIYKWECPAGTLYGQTDAYYSAECATEQAGVPFEVTDTIGTQQTTSDTNGRQIDGLMGQFTITEMVPAGYGHPAIFCQLLNDAQNTDYSATSPSVTLPPSFDDDYQCWFYNIPEEPSTVTIYKWECPQGEPADTTQTWFETNCTTPMDGVTFDITDTNGMRSKDTAGGMVEWSDVATGAVQIKETIPTGYSPNPYVVCQVQNDVLTDVVPPTINGVWNTTIPHGGTKITCHWYNWYLGPGEITVYKWTCPEGYDRTAWGANPKVDCTQATNGVTFILNQPDPEIDLQSDTGDNVPGAVYFGGLPPGDYKLTEMVALDSMQDIFVWECVGLNSSSVHPTPLSVGTSLNFTIVGGDKIECYWFNVPKPQYGWMVVTKFNCTTETYVSDVYCYTNQTGQEFNLQLWNGTSFTTVQSGTTDVSGKVMFNNLDAGGYKLVEPNATACLMKSSNITAGGNIGVAQGAETTVHVYNCSSKPPPQSGKTPTKYPNTGVGPVESSPSRLPGLEIAGLLALAGMQISRRRLLKGAAALGVGGAIAVPLTQAQELLPLDSTPVPGTPNAAALGCGTPTAGTPTTSSTPDMTGTPTIDQCNRGAIPLRIRIPEITVDAAIEYMEIIDGQMQAPTAELDVAWYKETSRLDEVGNGIYAGHLNWWGVPEAVFFRLESLQEGDIIELDGDDQMTYRYQVQWSQNFPSDEEPPEEALGFTEEKAITLITCGGEWITARSEYDHRTLVRAVLWEP